jgi:hypothetical protein
MKSVVMACALMSTSFCETEQSLDEANNIMDQIVELAKTIDPAKAAEIYMDRMGKFTETLAGTLSVAQVVEIYIKWSNAHINKLKDVIDQYDFEKLKSACNDEERLKIKYDFLESYVPLHKPLHLLLLSFLSLPLLSPLQTTLDENNDEKELMGAVILIYMYKRDAYESLQKVLSQCMSDTVTKLSFLDQTSDCNDIKKTLKNYLDIFAKSSNDIVSQMRSVKYPLSILEFIPGKISTAMD